MSSSKPLVQDQMHGTGASGCGVPSIAGRSMLGQRERFYKHPFLPIGMAAEELFLYSLSRETRILFAPRPLIPSGPGQRAEARETSPAESSGVPLRPILPSHLHPSPGLATCCADCVDAC